MKKAVGYIRSGISLKEYAKQEKAISEYCKKDGYEVIEWLRDELEGFGRRDYPENAGRIRSHETGTPDRSPGKRTEHSDDHK